MMADNSKQSGNASNDERAFHQARRSASTHLITRCDFLQRWSIEYCIYMIILVISAPYFLFYDLAVISREKYKYMEKSISQSWMVFRILGSKGFDNSDGQWGSFIASLPLAILFLSFFLMLSYYLRYPSVSSLRNKLMDNIAYVRKTSPAVDATKAKLIEPSGCSVDPPMVSYTDAVNHNNRSCARVNSSSGSSNSNNGSHEVRMMSHMNNTQYIHDSAIDNFTIRRNRTSHNHISTDNNVDERISNSRTSHYESKYRSASPTSTVLVGNSSALPSRIALPNPALLSYKQPSQSLDTRASLPKQNSPNELPDMHATAYNKSDECGDNSNFIVAVSSAQCGGSNLSYARQKQLYWMHFITGLILSLALSSSGALFGLALMCFNYYFIAMLHRRYAVPVNVCMALMWVCHVVMLFVNYYFDGYRFAWIGLGFLDNIWMPETRWTVQYNMSVLRMIAFNTDFWEASTRGVEQRLKTIQTHERSCVECANIREANSNFRNLAAESLRCYKCRSACPRNAGNVAAVLFDANNNVDCDYDNNTSNIPGSPSSLNSSHQHIHSTNSSDMIRGTESVGEYSLIAYLGYLYYPPLFVAGPMSSFNAYVSYIRFPTRAMTAKSILRYGLRFVLSTLTLLTIMHYIYLSALITPREQVNSFREIPNTSAALDKRSASRNDQKYSVVETLSFSRRVAVLFMSLGFLWLKFNCIWKFFRFVALLDGIDTPEDMPRMFINTTNIQSFWRNWHASFNIWIVRYMYIPLGGNKNKLLSIAPIFLFIAIWHDIELRLVFWAFSILVFLIPELIITSFLSRSQNQLITHIKKHRLAWQYIRMVGTTICIMELMLVNLIGFSIGENGALYELRKMRNEMTGLCFFMIVFHLMIIAALAIQDHDEERYTLQQMRIKYDIPR